MERQQRRRNTKKHRRGRHPGLYKAMSAALILAAVVAACVIFFRVREVEVYGNQRYTAQEIIDIAGVKEGANLFTVQGGRISRELRIRLPYVRTVLVRRILPDTLTITVTEGRAAAAIAQGGQWWLMDEDGKLLEQASAPGPSAQVTGVTPLAPAVGTYLAAGEDQEGRVERLVELLGALEENGLLEKTQSIDLSEDYRVTFVYDGRFTVHLSPVTEAGMSYWLRRFQAAVVDPKLNANQNYTVEIMDEERLRFIPE